MTINDVVKLTPEDKVIIQTLNHPEFTPEFLEEWLQNPPKNITSDIMAASLNERVKGFMAAVNQLKSQCVQMKIEGIYTERCREEDVRCAFENNEDWWAEKPEFDNIEDFDEFLNNPDFTKEVLQRFDKALTNNDVYCDAYWGTMDTVIEATLKEWSKKKKAA